MFWYIKNIIQDCMSWFFWNSTFSWSKMLDLCHLQQFFCNSIPRRMKYFQWFSVLGVRELLIYLHIYRTFIDCLYINIFFNCSLLYKEKITLIKFNFICCFIAFCVNVIWPCIHLFKYSGMNWVISVWLEEHTLSQSFPEWQFLALVSICRDREHKCQPIPTLSYNL